MKTKFVYALVSMAFFTGGAWAQGKMASPPAKAEGKVGDVKVTIDYHQPSAKGRKIMGGLVPYGQVWRTGANGTTTLEIDGPVKIEGKPLEKGKYGLYTLPGENEWVIIINKGIAWGAFSYKQEEDVLRVNVKPTKTGNFVETFNIGVQGNKVNLAWENTMVSFKLEK